jgi:hypothetical protein
MLVHFNTHNINLSIHTAFAFKSRSENFSSN